MMGRLGSATVNGRYSAFGDAVLARNASVDNQNTLKMLSNRRGPKGASEGERLVAQLPNIGTAEAIEVAQLMSNGKVLQKLKSEETIVDNFIKCAAKWRQKEDACYLKWQPGGEPLPLSAELGNAYMVSLLDMQL